MQSLQKRDELRRTEANRSVGKSFDRRSRRGRRRAAPLAANADRYVVLMIGITALLDGKLGREAARDGNRQHVLEGLVRGFEERTAPPNA